MYSARQAAQQRTNENENQIKIINQGSPSNPVYADATETFDPRPLNNDLASLEKEKSGLCTLSNESSEISREMKEYN